MPVRAIHWFWGPCDTCMSSVYCMASPGSVIVNISIMTKYIHTTVYTVQLYMCRLVHTLNVDVYLNESYSQ